MKIKRLDDGYSSHILKHAFASNFVDVPIFQLSIKGEIDGLLDRQFVFNELSKNVYKSFFAVGIHSFNGLFEAQKIFIDEESFVKKCHDYIVPRSLIESIGYSFQDFNGACYLIEITWKPSYKNFGNLPNVFSDRRTLNANFRSGIISYDFNESAIKKYIELRQEVDPNAIELSIELQSVPEILGLRSEDGFHYAAKAVFGNNVSAVKVIYVYAGNLSKIKRKDFDKLTYGNTNNRLKFINKINCFENTTLNDDSFTDMDSLISKSGCNLGSNFFQVNDSLNENIFRHDDINNDDLRAGIHSRGFIAPLRETIINAFCHGFWEVVEHGRYRDDYPEFDIYTRIAIVHAKNRIEIVNRLDEKNYFINKSGFDSVVRRSALHDAFRDINLAKGRTLGIKLIRMRLADLGMQPPIFIRQRGIFRAVIPLSNVFSKLCIPKSRGNSCKEEIKKLYILNLVLFLKEVDFDIIHSVFCININDSVKILDDLYGMGVLLKEIPHTYGQGYSNSLMPTYLIKNEILLNNVIKEIEGRMDVFDEFESISIGSLYLLSKGSIVCLTEKDFYWYISDIFRKEIISDSKSKEMTEKYISLIKSCSVFNED